MAGPVQAFALQDPGWLLQYKQPPAPEQAGIPHIVGEHPLPAFLPCPSS